VPTRKKGAPDVKKKKDQVLNELASPIRGGLKRQREVSPKNTRGGKLGRETGRVFAQRASAQKNATSKIGPGGKKKKKKKNNKRRNGSRKTIATIGEKSKDRPMHVAGRAQMP